MSKLTQTSVQFLKGVGPARKKILENLGVQSVEDLLYLFPRRYEDRSKMTLLSQVKIGEFQTVSGKVIARGSRQSWFTRKHVYETVIDDGTGRIFGVWFNQPYLDNYFQPGTEVVLYGQAALYKNRIQMISPEYEIIDKSDKSLSMGRIVPIYPLTKGISQRYLRKIIHNCIATYSSDLIDTLPVATRNKHRLLNINESLENIHFPENQIKQEEAQRRISFEEFLFFHLSIIKRRMNVLAQPGTQHVVDEKFRAKFKSCFPFSFTNAQKRVMEEIVGDMRKASPMLRLLQGDVGCGKTVVALMGCLAAIENKKQSVFMAPTEILARQHFENIKKILENSEFQNIHCSLLVGSLPENEKIELRKKIKTGTIDLLIGTHALLSEDVRFKDLSYVVIDEQHKFGVRQRAFISQKGLNPDVLVMTATPIPRTLSLTLFGDLDVSTIDELPPGRGKIGTKVLPLEKAPNVYAFIRDEVAKGRQVYIIYPLVDESEALDLKAAQTSFKHFEKNEFKGLKVGLVHGQMKRDDADAVMQKFKKGEIQILVATSVLEVGVDVPNATVMVIEHAERFGLAQLHQLRGRIGRGSKESFCFLLSDPVTPEAIARLKAIVSTTDGFKIAEADLMIRGPGQYFGRHQHGLNELRFANPLLQIDILQLARLEAEDLTQADPELNDPKNQNFKEIIQKRYPDYLTMATAG
ncbi:MAG: ATP-dependent DNA helicase RecG [Candidatus Omnitrophica bacterium]|nr:ATP-dependent DNA helicase RecG [Candidatus Omnitrophota bacterium]